MARLPPAYNAGLPLIFSTKKISLSSLSHTLSSYYPLSSSTPSHVLSSSCLLKSRQWEMGVVTTRRETYVPRRVPTRQAATMGVAGALSPPSRQTAPVVAASNVGTTSAGLGMVDPSALASRATDPLALDLGMTDPPAPPPTRSMATGVACVLSPPSRRAAVVAAPSDGGSADSSSNAVGDDRSCMRRTIFVFPILSNFSAHVDSGGATVDGGGWMLRQQSGGTDRRWTRWIHWYLHPPAHGSDGGGDRKG